MDPAADDVTETTLFPSEQVDARKADLARTAYELPLLAQWLAEEEGYDVDALYLDPTGRLLVVGPYSDGDRMYRVETMSADEALSRFGVGQDLADEYRGLTDPWYSPDLGQVPGPTPHFVAEVDAVLGAARGEAPQGPPVPPAFPAAPSGISPVQLLAERLEHLVEEYPTDDPREISPVRLTVTDPTTGQAHEATLHPGHVTWLIRLVEAELNACRDAQLTR